VANVGVAEADPGRDTPEADGLSPAPGAVTLSGGPTRDAIPTTTQRAEPAKTAAGLRGARLAESLIS